MKIINRILLVMLGSMVWQLSACINSQLRQAAERGDTPTVQRLFEGHAAANARPPLIMAYNDDVSGLPQELQELLSNNPDLALGGVSDIDDNTIEVKIRSALNINSIDVYCWTALMKAARFGHTEIVELLLQAGADVNRRNTGQETALHIAAQNGHPEIVRALLTAKDVDVNGKDIYSATPLMMAARNGHTEVVQILLNAGVDINAQHSRSTALIQAAMNGHKEVVESLLLAKADSSLKNHDNRTAHYYATEYNYSEIVELLAHKKVDRQAQILIECAKNKSMGLVKRVIVDETVILDLIKYYRPILVECLNWGIIKENHHKKSILDRALLDNDILMIQALIASEYLIPKNILQKPMGKEAQAFLTKHLATVETLFMLREVPEAEATFGTMPKELMHYLVAGLAIDERPASNA